MLFSLEEIKIYIIKIGPFAKNKFPSKNNNNTRKTGDGLFLSFPNYSWDNVVIFM